MRAYIALETLFLLIGGWAVAKVNSRPRALADPKLYQAQESIPEIIRLHHPTQNEEPSMVPYSTFGTSATLKSLLGHNSGPNPGPYAVPNPAVFKNIPSSSKNVPKKLQEEPQVSPGALKNATTATNDVTNTLPQNELPATKNVLSNVNTTNNTALVPQKNLSVTPSVFENVSNSTKNTTKAPQEDLSVPFSELKNVTANTKNTTNENVTDPAKDSLTVPQKDFSVISSYFENVTSNAKNDTKAPQEDLSVTLSEFKNVTANTKNTTNENDTDPAKDSTTVPQKDIPIIPSDFENPFNIKNTSEVSQLNPSAIPIKFENVTDNAEGTTLVPHKELPVIASEVENVNTTAKDDTTLVSNHTIDEPFVQKDPPLNFSVFEIDTTTKLNTSSTPNTSVDVIYTPKDLQDIIYVFGNDTISEKDLENKLIEDIHVQIDLPVTPSVLENFTTHMENTSALHDQIHDGLNGQEDLITPVVAEIGTTVFNLTEDIINVVNNLTSDSIMSENTISAVKSILIEPNQTKDAIDVLKSFITAPNMSEYTIEALKNTIAEPNMIQDLLKELKVEPDLSVLLRNNKFGAKSILPRIYGHALGITASSADHLGLLKPIASAADCLSHKSVFRTLFCFLEVLINFIKFLLAPFSTQ